MTLRVGFGDHSQALARTLHRQFAGKAADALDAGAGEDRNVDARLQRQPGMHAAADAGIFALGVLTHDHPVDLFGKLRPQRPLHAGHKPCRADIGELVEALADGKAQLPERNMVRDLRVADGAEIDGMKAAQPLDAVFRHHAAGAAVAVRAPIEALGLQAEAAIHLGRSL